MSGPPPQLRDQAEVRSGLRTGGAIIAGIGAILAIVGIGSFLSAMGSASPPTLFPMAVIGVPMVGIGIKMMKAGYVGTAARYVAGEVMPTVKDSLGYVGIGAQQVTCAKCGGTNRADAKFCDHCGAALGITCPSCGHVNAADSAFCDECGKPLTA